MVEMGKFFCRSFLQSVLKNINRISCNDGSRELIPVFHNPHRNVQPSPLAVARKLVYLVGVPSKAASSGREKKQVRIDTRNTRKYLEGGYQVSPKPQPLQEIKAQPLQSLFVGEVANAS